MFVTAAPELLLPGPIYLVLILVILAVLAYVRPACGLRRFRHVLLALACWSWLASTPVLANLLVRSLEGPPAATVETVEHNPETVIVVLASGEVWLRGGMRQTRLDINGWERVEAAVSLWRRTGGRIVMAGGPHDIDAALSFAGVMASVAQSMGVPKEAIIVSPRSARTYEDLLHAKHAVDGSPGPVWLVTSAMHMNRALAVAQHLGWEVRPWRCDYRQNESPTWRAWLPNNGGPRLFADALHEMIGLYYYKLRGWALSPAQ